MCTLDTVLATSWDFANWYNVSLSEIHQYLLYGFNLNWNGLICSYGQGGVDPYMLVNCHRSSLQRKWDYIKESFLSPKGKIIVCPTGGFLMILMFILDKDAVTMTAARGTVGYVAPELNCRSIGLVSHKADVYSFGMLLMEMAGVNKKDDPNKYFPDWIYDCINNGEDLGIVEEDNNVDDVNENGKNVLKKMTIVGLWCIQMNPNNRPSMDKVLEMLEGDVEDLKIPEHPSHLVKEARSWAADSTGSLSESESDYDSDSIKISIA
ncbi:hypothetical protein SASPL_157268 [Salvia splendens]|uniref:Protein kinase domain-containing protein n=1 Tax=Salvia splendens TaxID=180675 RepID=A0A8X8VVB6_SALSN|nr:hypothetical protein SASPL_157268 [Salvia splendens]